MPLVKDGKIADDLFVHVADGAELPGDGAILVPAARFLEDPEALLKRAGKVGVIWPNNRDLDDLVPYLDRLAAVALVFPTFRDGRAYSQARLLRERHGYRRRIARHRPGAARPVRVHAARRLRRVRGEEGQPTPRRSPRPRSAIRCSTSRPATAASPRCIGGCSCVIRRVPASERIRASGVDRDSVGAAAGAGARSRAARRVARGSHRSGVEGRRPREARAGVVVRHGIGGAAQGDGGRRSGDPRGLPRHRLAVRGDAGLSRHADRDARPARRPLDQAAGGNPVARGSGPRIVVLRSRRLLPHPQSRAAGARAGAVLGLDQRPQAFPGRRCAPKCRSSRTTARG